jgi:peptidoglycan/LPS O-acetylase OafA/YrhL
MFHYGAAFSQRIQAPSMVTTFLQNGNMGVSFFFVLSGFILTYTYRDRLSSRSAVVEYFVARFARIYPVYLLALAIALPVLTSPISLAETVKVLLMIQSWTSPSDPSANAWISQAWTLSVEAFFYLSFPVMLLAAGRMSTTSATVTAIVVGLLIWALGVPKVAPGTGSPVLLPPSLVLPLPVLRLLEFALGMLACRIFLNTPQPRLECLGGWKTSITALSIVGILSTSTSPHVASIATLLFPILLIQLAVAGSFLSTFFSTPAMLLLGGASYALYIFQGPLREWARLLLPVPIDAFVNALIAPMFAVLVFLFWERPLQRWLRQTFEAVLKRSARAFN